MRYPCVATLHVCGHRLHPPRHQNSWRQQHYAQSSLRDNLSHLVQTSVRFVPKDPFVPQRRTTPFSQPNNKRILIVLVIFIAMFPKLPEKRLCLFKPRTRWQWWHHFCHLECQLITLLLFPRFRCRVGATKCGRLARWHGVVGEGWHSGARTAMRIANPGLSGWPSTTPVPSRFSRRAMCPSPNRKCCQVRLPLCSRCMPACLGLTQPITCDARGPAVS